MAVKKVTLVMMAEVTIDIDHGASDVECLSEASCRIDELREGARISEVFGICLYRPRPNDNHDQAALDSPTKAIIEDDEGACPILERTK